MSGFDSCLCFRYIQAAEGRAWGQVVLNLCDTCHSGILFTFYLQLVTYSYLFLLLFQGKLGC